MSEKLDECLHTEAILNAHQLVSRLVDLHLEQDSSVEALAAAQQLEPHREGVNGEVHYIAASRPC